MKRLLKPAQITCFAFGILALLLPVGQLAVILMPNSYPIQVQVLLMAVSFVPSIIFFVSSEVLKKMQK